MDMGIVGNDQSTGEMTGVDGSASKKPGISEDAGLLAWSANDCGHLGRTVRREPVAIYWEIT
jgi:hypothetical protein